MKKKLSNLVFILLGFIVVGTAVYTVAESSFFTRQVFATPSDTHLEFLPIVMKPAAGIQPPDGMIYIDHNSVALFDQIPDQYITAAENIDMFFMDRSVGGNIDDGLTCLSSPTDEDAPSRCVRWEHGGTPSYSVDPLQELNWNRPGGYNRSNWDFEYWPSGCSEWYDKVDCFMARMDQIINQYDVVSFQFSYLSVDDSSTIADTPGGFFSNNPTRSDVYDLEAYEAAHPGKVFIYWTTSLSRGIGTDVATTFNDQMRLYAISNDKVLFDVADILSHQPDGTPCYDNRDGVAYSFGSNSENHPDDGQDIPAICPHYTTEVDGGHLGTVSAGKIRVAKAYWVLMARLAGWDGN